jgi:hypothetical protein
MMRRNFISSLLGFAGVLGLSSLSTIAEELKELELEVRGMT